MQLVWCKEKLSWTNETTSCISAVNEQNVKRFSSTRKWLFASCEILCSVILLHNEFLPRKVQSTERICCVVWRVLIYLPAKTTFEGANVCALSCNDVI